MRKSYAEKGIIKFSLITDRKLSEKEQLIIDKFGEEIGESIYDLIRERLNTFEEEINKNLIDTIQIDCTPCEMSYSNIDGDTGYLFNAAFELLGNNLLLEIEELENKLIKDCGDDIIDSEAAERAVDCVMNCNFKDAARELLMSKNSARFCSYFIENMKNNGYDDSVILGKYNQMLMSYFNRVYFDKE